MQANRTDARRPVSFVVRSPYEAAEAFVAFEMTALYERFNLLKWSHEEPPEFYREMLAACFRWNSLPIGDRMRAQVQRCRTATLTILGDDDAPSPLRLVAEEIS